MRFVSFVVRILDKFRKFYGIKMIICSVEPSTRYIIIKVILKWNRNISRH